MVPRASRNVRYGWPLGKAACATRAVSSGTGAMTCGWSDMTDVLWLMECRHDKNRGRYYAIACFPGALRGSGSTLQRIFYYRNIFCSKLIKKAPRQTNANGTSCPRTPLAQMFILVATF